MGRPPSPPGGEGRGEGLPNLLHLPKLCPSTPLLPRRRPSGDRGRCPAQPQTTRVGGGASPTFNLTRGGEGLKQFSLSPFPIAHSPFPRHQRPPPRPRRPNPLPRRPHPHPQSNSLHPPRHHRDRRVPTSRRRLPRPQPTPPTAHHSQHPRRRHRRPHRLRTHSPPPRNQAQGREHTFEIYSLFSRSTIGTSDPANAASSSAFVRIVRDPDAFSRSTGFFLSSFRSTHPSCTIASSAS